MIYRSSKIYYLALSKGLILPKGSIGGVTYIIQGSYRLYCISQTKEDSMYPAHLHTKQIGQTQ